MYGNKSGDKANVVQLGVCCEALLYLQLAQYARLVHLRGGYIDTRICKRKPSACY